MPSSEPKYLNLGWKKAAGCGKYGSYPKYRKLDDSWECSFGNQLNVAVADGSSWSHSKIPLMENYVYNPLLIDVMLLIFHLTGDGSGKCRFS